MASPLRHASLRARSLARDTALRGLGAMSRRLDRPEIMSVADAGMRQAQYDAIASRAIVAAVLGPACTYVDVGTNRGQWLADACRCAPDATHLAFEPIPELCAQIAARFPTVDLRAVALAETPGQARFCRYRNLDGWSGLRQRSEVADEYRWIDVRVARLDDEVGDRAPALIKIDVEGAEVDVLLGARRTLAAHRPTVVFEHQMIATTLYEHTSEELWGLFDDLGYRIFDLQGGGPYGRDAYVECGGAGTFVNWLAVPS